jgi:hypothetical protein
VLYVSVAYLISLPGRVKKYKRSKYFIDFGKPYKKDIEDSPQYRFYTNADSRKLSINYIIQKDGTEYFIYDNVVYLFPDFSWIEYVEELAEWCVEGYDNWCTFIEEFNKKASNIDQNAKKHPVKILVERNMFSNIDLNGLEIPDCIFLTWNYEKAFENEESFLKLKVPTTTQELYDMMLQTSQLCGRFYVDENDCIKWDLYDDYTITIAINDTEGYISLDSKSVFKGGLTHWHPSHFEIYDDVCSLGSLGNVLVIRKGFVGVGVVYLGDKENCPYNKNKSTLFGKLYFFEIK